jgi:hypothetical protein
MKPLHAKFRFLALALIVSATAALAACNSWDKQTYQALAASKAVIDQAASEYNAGQVPQTATVRNLIAKARTAQTAAVEAFQAYAAAKLVGSSDVATKQAAVATLLGDVTALVGQIQDALAHAPPPTSGG